MLITLCLLCRTGKQLLDGQRRQMWELYLSQEALLKALAGQPISAPLQAAESSSQLVCIHMRPSLAMSRPSWTCVLLHRTLVASLLENVAWISTGLLCIPWPCKGIADTPFLSFSCTSPLYEYLVPMQMQELQPTSCAGAVVRRTGTAIQYDELLCCYLIGGYSTDKGFRQAVCLSIER